MVTTATGDVRLLQYFPNKMENVFFHFCSSKYRNHMDIWENSGELACQAIEQAIKAGGVNFICRNSELADRLFMEQVIKCKERYPYIKLFACHKDRYDNFNGTTKLADQTICLFPNKSVRRTPNYLECMLSISGQIITYVGEGQIKKSAFIRTCNKKGIPFINLGVPVRDNSASLCKPFNQCTDLQTGAFQAAQNIVLLAQQDKRLQEWQYDRETIYIRLEQEKEPLLITGWIEKLRESDLWYQNYISNRYIAYGTQQIYALASSLAKPEL